MAAIVFCVFGSLELQGFVWKQMRRFSGVQWLTRSVGFFPWKNHGETGETEFVTDASLISTSLTMVFFSRCSGHMSGGPSRCQQFWVKPYAVNWWKVPPFQAIFSPSQGFFSYFKAHPCVPGAVVVGWLVENVNGVVVEMPHLKTLLLIVPLTSQVALKHHPVPSVVL